MRKYIIPDPERDVWQDSPTELRRLDGAFANVIDKVGPPRVRLVDDPFQAVAIGIIRQQLSSQIADGILGRIADQFGGMFPSADQILERGKGSLAVQGLTKRRVDYVWDLAEQINSGKSEIIRARGLGDEEALQALQSATGVGPWTAAMVLVFSHGRPDIFVPGDSNLRASLQRLYGLEKAPTPEEMERTAKRWRPHRSAALWYLWRSGENIHPGLA